MISLGDVPAAGAAEAAGLGGGVRGALPAAMRTSSAVTRLKVPVPWENKVRG